MNLGLSSDLNYLNMQEIKAFCKEFGIPYKIHYQHKSKICSSGEVDRKDIILTRFRQYLETGSFADKTIYPANVVCFDPLPLSLKADDRVYYGQYKTTEKSILTLMKTLTQNQFKFGALSQIVIRDFWRIGKAPTYQQFANAWKNAVKAHNKPRPEWAFLTNLAAGMDRKDWKKYREKKSREVLTQLRSCFLKKIK